MRCCVDSKANVGKPFVGCAKTLDLMDKQIPRLD